MTHRKFPPVFEGKTYSVCSGQSGRGVFSRPRKNDWAICYTDPKREPWWRLEDKAGRIRTFPSAEAAGRVVARLEAENQ